MMKRTGWLLLATAAISAAREADADLYVTQVGDGAATLTSGSTAATIQIFTDAGAPLSSMALPTAASGANKPLTLSGSATSEGFLTLSTNGQYLTIGGYAAAPGVASIVGTPAPTVNRVVGRINLSTAAIDTTTALTDTFSGNNIRSVVTTNGTDLWLAGSNGGVRYATMGAATSSQVSSTVTNLRVVNVVNNQLYVSAGSGAFRGVNAVGSGAPTGSGETTVLLPGFDPAGTSPQSVYDYWFKDASTLYVADDRSAAAATPGGIQKWTSNGTTWSHAYTLAVGGGAGGGARGLAGAIVDGDAVLFATTTETSANRLVTVTDTGAGAEFTLLQTAPANTAFRGVEFVGDIVDPPANNSDFDDDGDVDGADFLAWQTGLGLPASGKSTGDANGDGSVDDADLGVWATHYGLPPAVAAAGAIPEPRTWALSGLAIAGVLRFGAPRSKLRG